MQADSAACNEAVVDTVNAEEIEVVAEGGDVFTFIKVNVTVETVSDLKQELSRDMDFANQNYLLFHGAVQLEDHDIVEFGQRYHLREPITLTIQNLGSDQEVVVSKKSTVIDVMKHYENETSVTLAGPLTMAGIKMDDDEAMADIGAFENQVLVCQIYVTVRDRKSGEEERLIVRDSDTLNDVRQEYVLATKKEVMRDAVFAFEGTDLAETMDMNLYTLNIVDGATVEYYSPPYTIKIKEGTKEAVEIEVMDYYTPDLLREAYFHQVKDQLTGDDKFVFRDEDLSEDAELYAAGVTRDETVYLVREDHSQAHLYICADCGSEVRLKRDDVIRCRACGYRIVYKPRDPAQLKQYIAV
jgi:DNA-directed RNA polymerase subunit RPC12/RpoP